MELRSFFITIGVIGLCLFGIPIRLDNSKLSEHKLMFQSYVQKYNKHYTEDSQEYELRFQKFQESLKLIEKLNSERISDSSAYYGLTKFSDLSPVEFIQHKLQASLSKRLRKHQDHHVSSTYRQHRRHHTKNHLVKRTIGGTDLPSKVDWREKGAVTSINNQKDCGACWAFSTIQTVESMTFIKTGTLQKLSVQQAIDCARNGNLGCDGGDTCSLIAWLADNKIRVEPDKSYPLALKTQTCKLPKLTSGGVLVASNYTCDYLVGDEDTLLALLAFHGPVAVAVNALSWQFYLGGVIQFHCDGSPQNLNHAVQIVGYDLTAEIPHYIVRNSWSTTFGDKGYIYLAIGKNICGLATEVAGLDIL